MKNTKEKLNINEVVDDFFGKNDLKFDSLLELIAEQIDNPDKDVLEEKKSGRFSYMIDIPALVPSEAWGDPDHQSRKNIERVFASVRREPDIKSRIEHVNSFIDPAQAKSKGRGGRFNAIINMMQIIEALQATLNDYTESSAGFVFEGFMAALTGGSQQADRVGGTLPIEDFVTADKENVSLKLLSPGTGIHGSFTNLLDYLYLREGGNDNIKYLIAYKDSDGDDVSKLLIYDFVINQKNFVEVMIQSGNGDKFGRALKPVTIKVKDPATGKVIKKTLPSFPDLAANYENTDEWRGKMKQLLVSGAVPGYTKAGMFKSDDIVDASGAMLSSDEADAASDEKAAKLAAKKSAEYLKRFMGKYESIARRFAAQAAYAGVSEEEAWRQYTAEYGEEMVSDSRPPVDSRLYKDDEALKNANEKADKTAKRMQNKIRKAFKDDYESSIVSESWFGSFHEREKIFLQEQRILAEGGKKGDGSQWTITGDRMVKMTNLINLRPHGELNMSEENIRKCAEIYIGIIDDKMISLLTATKEFATNVGEYFSLTDRKTANKKADAAVAKGSEIVTSLKGRDKEEEA